MRAGGSAGRGGGPALPARADRRLRASSARSRSEPLTRIQKISGPRLHASWVNIPHVTQFDEADITELEALRVALKETAQKRGIKLTPLAFIIRPSSLALAAVPAVQRVARPSGENLVFKKYFHIGFAADTPNGLVVPVIRDADQKDIYEIAQRAARALGEGARPASSGRPTCRAAASRSRASAASAARLHADHQRAGGRDPRRVAERDAAGVRTAWPSCRG